MQPTPIFVAVLSVLFAQFILSGSTPAQQDLKLPPLRPTQASEFAPRVQNQMSPPTRSILSDRQQSFNESPSTYEPPPTARTADQQTSPGNESSYGFGDLRNDGLAPVKQTTPTRNIDRSPATKPMFNATQDIPTAPSLAFPAPPSALQNQNSRITDQGLRPAVYSNSSPQSFESNPISPAKTLLRELQAETSDVPTVGQPVALVNLTANCEASRRLEMIGQYWKTYQAWANYRFAIDQLKWLQQLGQTRMVVESLTLDAAISSASNSVDEKRLALTQEQEKLRQYMRNATSELPIPEDLPFIGKYRTNFEVYSASTTMPEKFRIIHQWLPNQRSLISGRADTVQRCRTAVLQATHAFQQRQLGIGSMLQAIDLCRQNHQSFIQSVVDYNTTIADYALSVKPHQKSPDQVVAMLIPKKSTMINDFVSPGLRQARLDGAYNAPRQPSAATTRPASTGSALATPSSNTLSPMTPSAFQPTADSAKPIPQSDAKLFQNDGFGRGVPFRPAGSGSQFRR